MGKGCFCQKLQCPVIVHVVAAKHTAVTVGGVFTHAHIGNEIHLREIFSCLTKGFLDDTFRVIAEPRLSFAGQITGVEGYVESAASGLLAGLSTAYREKGQEPPHFSGKTAIGAMGRYVSTSNARFQPMNCAFGLIDQLEVAPGEKRIRNKQLRYEAISKRALAEVEKIVAEMAKE